MRLREDEVIAEIEEITLRQLRFWVRSGWVRPAQAKDGPRFDELDLARVRLIRELRVDMSLDAQAVPVVLSLIDQIHGLRLELKSITEALDEQPEDIRARIIRARRLLNED